MSNSQMIAIPLDPDSDEDVSHFRFSGKGRLILETDHGQIIIDIRREDVNAFTLLGRRVDHLLLPAGAADRVSASE